MPTGPDIRAELLDIARSGAPPDQALARCERVLEQDPDCLPALVLAARLHRALGRPKEAARRVGRALELDPRAIPALAEHGVQAMAAGDWTAAVRALEAVTRERPQLADAWFNLGLARESLGLPGPAARAYGEAAARGGGAEALVRLAGALAMTGDTAAARATFAAVLEAEPGRTDAQLGLGMVALAEGGQDEAVKRFRAAVEVEPDMAEAWQQLLAARRIESADDPDLAAVLERLERQDLPTDQRERLGFAAGKALDDLGLYGEAWKHFRRANALKRDHTGGFDRDAWLAAAETAAARQPAPVIEATGVGPRPVFILGMPRSGTTLVDQILTAHPAAAGVGELPLVAGPGRPAEAMEDFRKHLAASRAKVVTNKYPAHFQFLADLAAAFPGARFVHVVRHPLDTCLSVYLQDFPTGNLYANDLGDIAAYYHGYRRIVDAWAGKLGERILNLAYEKLVQDQEATTRRLLDFCGLEWDPACLAFADNPRPVGTLSQWQVRQPLYHSSRERWRNYEFALGPLREALARYL